MATNRYICEVCHKGFQRDQNLQLHRRGHNLPWKLKQRPANIQVKKRVYVCPEPNCVHHDPTRALGDLTGIKKHFCRKHGEKKWKCDKCSKRYAVQSDWKAHAKICGTREYHCDRGTIFSRKDSFVTHRAFCDALTEENYKMNLKVGEPHIISHDKSLLSNDFDPIFNRPSSIVGTVAYTSATALLQKAAEMGAKVSDNTFSPVLLRGSTTMDYCNTTTSFGAMLTETGPAGYGIATTTTDKSGLYDSSSLLMHCHSSKERQEFMTVDFLGGIPYSNDQHTPTTIRYT
ncbi:protein indeterminate-domain 12-like [Bidens hawaiensis]|uniref:protein indeterminate-domain 12-like n=1 Tax=Bidens hawaiensis TaxID=980011 RepID=UPI00404B4498